jgi:hypothetical protein
MVKMVIGRVNSIIDFLILISGPFICNKIFACIYNSIIPNSFNRRDHNLKWEQADHVCSHFIKLVNSFKSRTPENAAHFQGDRSDLKAQIGYHTALQAPDLISLTFHVKVSAFP